LPNLTGPGLAKRPPRFSSARRPNPRCLVVRNDGSGEGGRGFQRCWTNAQGPVT